MILRKAEQSILSGLQQFPALGLIGMRQVGKTTLAKKVLSQSGSAIYLDLELSSDLAKLENPELFLSSLDDQLVVIDEVQRKPELFPLIRALIDQNRRPGRFLLLGSASPELLRQSSESLAGRIKYTELTPLVLPELNAENDLTKHWVRGGLPESFLASSDALSREWLDAFISTMIERDLPSLGMPGSPSLTNRLLRMLAHQTANVWNASDFGRSLDLTYHTVNRYVDLLESSFLIHKLEPHYVNLKKRLVKSPKVFIRDTGILHRFLGITDMESLSGHPKLGASFETYCIEQIANNIGGDSELTFYRTHKGAEIDLVITHADMSLTTVEIKYSSSPKLSPNHVSAIEDLNASNNFIVTPKGDDYLLREDIRTCSLSTFLKEYL
ncbi:MAG: putative AAA+ superfamily ATPase [Flavobacteriales bacterium]|jgi:predicted AAA+ superfamily ATPase